MLHKLRPASGSRRPSKRLARGSSAGGGTTAGRGTKGQQSRAGKGKRLGFEGGQVPLIRRQPKLGGFTPPRQKTYEVVNIETLEAKLPAGTYSLQDLAMKRIIRTNRPVKLLARGSVKKAFVLEAHAASKAAKEAIKKAGGTFSLIK